MAIIKCPECGHQTSDKATTCPSCGVEIAGKIVKCAHCGEVYFKSDGLCPNCYRPYEALHHTDAEEGTASADETPQEIEDPNTTSATDTLPESDDKALPTDTSKENPDEIAEDATTTESAVEEEDPLPIEESDTVESDTDKNDETSEESTTNEEEVSEDSEEQDIDGNSYIDTDGESLEKPVHIEDSTGDDSSRRHSYIPIVVSLAITAMIAAVSFYLYNDTKISMENEAFETAMNSGDIDQINSFLRNFSDATPEHRQAATAKINEVTQESEALSLSLATKDKSKLEEYLTDYPDTPQKQYLLSIIDSLDWEDAQKTNTKAAYDKYIADHANGIFIKDANEAKEKLTVKIINGTPEDNAMAKTLFREFFLGVNGNDAARMTAMLSSNVTNFMGTPNVSNSEVIGWMKRQHGEDVSNVIWKIDHNYNISKSEFNGKVEYVMTFKAQKTVVKKDGRSSTEHFKITSNVTGNNKISSMNMVKYTPSSNASGSNGSNGSSGARDTRDTRSSSNSSSKPSTSNNTSSKASTSKASTSKPSTSNTSSKASTSKPSTSNTSSKPSTSKPSTSNTSSKPSTSKPSTSKPSTSKPSTSSKSSSSQKP